MADIRHYNFKRATAHSSPVAAAHFVLWRVHVRVDEAGHYELAILQASHTVRLDPELRQHSGLFLPVGNSHDLPLLDHDATRYSDFEGGQGAFSRKRVLTQETIVSGRAVCLTHLLHHHYFV